MKNIPVISITRKTIDEAYDAVLIAVFKQGNQFKSLPK